MLIHVRPCPTIPRLYMSIPISSFVGSSWPLLPGNGRNCRDLLRKPLIYPLVCEKDAVSCIVAYALSCRKPRTIVGGGASPVTARDFRDGVLFI